MIRRAVATDASAVAAIMNDVIANTTATFTTITKTLDQVTQEIAPPELCIVAEIGGKIVGYTRFFTFRSGPGYAHVAEYSIVLTKAAQGRGIGRALLENLCDLARESGKTQLIGAISGHNTAAIAFHTSVGFVQVGHIPAAGIKWGEPLDLVLMQKRL